MSLRSTPERLVEPTVALEVLLGEWPGMNRRPWNILSRSPPRAIPRIVLP